MEQKVLYSIGQKVRCKPGFNTSELSQDCLSGGGAGYKEGKEFIVERITSTSKGYVILWPQGDHRGIYQNAVEPIDSIEGLVYQINLELNNGVRQS